MSTYLRPGYDKLWGWFGLSYASFLTLPRILMHAMPDEWQGKMADLLQEYEDTFASAGHAEGIYGTRVQPYGLGGKLMKWPTWLLNYRRPDAEKIDSLKHFVQHPDASVT